jgi:hypothetical protein
MDRGDEYELFEINRNPIRSPLLSAMEVAKKFIISNDLIITGGMAIDFALRNVGDSLYNPNSLNGVVPDYDCYSPDPVKHAYDLVEELYEYGYTNDGFYRLDAIRAKHIQTIRVRLEYKSVIEISYIPPKIFANLPKLKYMNMLIIHPHWQMINMHRSLSYPLIDPPFESLFNRLKKDTERFMMLLEKYPIAVEIYMMPQNNINIVKILDEIAKYEKTDKEIVNPNEIRISQYDFFNGLKYENKSFEDIILFGFAAYPFYYIEYSRIIDNFKSILGDKLPNAFDNIHNSGIELKNTTDAEKYKFDNIKIPMDEISFITSNSELIKSIFADDTWIKYEPFLDYLLPSYFKKFEGYNVTIFHLYNTFIPISKINFNNTYVNVANANNILTYFLVKYNVETNERKNVYLTFYLSIINMIKNISKLIDRVMEKFGITDGVELGDKNAPKEILKVISYVLESPFFISKKLYGKHNKSESFLYSELQDYKRLLSMKPINNMTAPMISLPNVPERSYQPGVGPRPSNFNYEDSCFFKISGEVIN